MKEIWKDIYGYEGKYQVSNKGRVKSLKRRGNCESLILKEINLGDGYLYVWLWKNGTKERVLLHRLVLSTFFPVINMNELEVNHINEIKSDNRLDNLEWCDRSYNVNYGKRNSKVSKTMGKKVKCLTTGKEFDSIREAAKFYRLSNSGLSAHLRGEYKSYGNINGNKMYWKYIK